MIQQKGSTATLEAIPQTAQQTAAHKTTQTQTAPNLPLGTPAEQERVQAMAAGLVWTNPVTKVYHKNGEFYGRTRSGKYMTEDEAIRQYYRPSPGHSERIRSIRQKRVF